MTEEQNEEVEALCDHIEEKDKELDEALHWCVVNEAAVHFGWVDGKPWHKVHAPGQRIAEGETFLGAVQALSQANAQLENQEEE